MTKKIYRLQPSDLGDPEPSVDLQKALQLADALEDEELLRRLAMPVEKAGRASLAATGTDEGVEPE